MIHPHAPPACRPGRQDNRPETEGLRQAEGKQPMTTMDLNSDLGESFGAWRMGDDEAILRVVTSANVACGFHAGDPAGILATVRGRSGARRARRGPRGLPRSGGLWPPQHGCDQRRAAGRRDVPDWRAARAGHGRWHAGALRQAARRALQHHRPRRAPGQSRHRRRAGGGSQRWCWSPWPVPRWCSGRATRA